MKPAHVAVSFFLAATLLIPVPASQAQSDSRTVTVFAASSLTKAFSALGASFQAAHPGITVRFSFASSTTLATQINSGAPADIFVSADVSAMSSVVAEVPNPIAYLVNQVVVAVPRGSKIRKISDLNAGFKWLQCSHSVPCGIAADSALASEGSVTSTPVSLESSDASAVAKLLAGSVDAAIVYKTDVVANQSKLTAITFANTAAASTQYQLGISTQKRTAKSHWAQTFFDYLKGHNAKKLLAASGFTISQ